VDTALETTNANTSARTKLHAARLLGKRTGLHHC
jgi:hypothetical protein